MTQDNSGTAPEPTESDEPRPATPAVTPGSVQAERVDGSPETAENTTPTEEAAPGIPSAGRVIADDEK